MMYSSISSAAKRIATFALACLLILLGIRIASSQTMELSVPTSNKVNTQSIITATPTSTANSCRRGTGWKWTYGPSRPEIASQVQQTLSQIGIDSLVAATAFGEADSCGEFRLYAIDFAITIKEPIQETAQRQVAEEIYPILAKYGKPNLGNVKITFGSNNTLFLPSGSTSAPRLPAPLFTNQKQNPNDVLNRKVYVLAYDPILSNGKNLSAHLHWNSHATLTQGTIDFFKQASNNRLTYTIVYTTVVTDGWPEKVDGFRYTEQEYLSVIAGHSPPHMPDNVDYTKIVNSPRFDICGKANRGEIDEVWIYNGPYFGFYESTLVGPGAYWFNSPPVPGPTACTRLIPIMGPSPERGLECAIENFGHRMEATMTRVYGSWQQNRTTHNWERFALVKALSPNYSYSGCGNVHYPPNGTSDYDYGNPSTVLSNCRDFVNYPFLSDPLVVAQPVTCSAWDCAHLSYFTFWFGHLPANPGCGPDTVANSWWKYFAHPEFALNPSRACASYLLFLPNILR